MPTLITPPRKWEREILDAPGVDPRLVRRSLLDVVRSNTLFGGARAVLAEVDRAMRDLAAEATLLDVGTGLADIPAKAARRAQRRGIALTTIGLDVAETLARACRGRVTAAVVGDAIRLPFRDHSVDIVTCSQVLHHFPDDLVRHVARELDRVARVRVIVSDIRRSRIAAAGLWLASFPLRFHPVSRHDGVVSVMRGFTTRELARVVADATGQTAEVRRRLGFRVTASWRPRGA